MTAEAPRWSWSAELGCLRPRQYPDVPADARETSVHALLAWARSVLPTVGQPESARSRPWSMTLQLGSGADCLWLKADAAGLAHEGPLLAALSAAGHSDLLVELVAHDPERGFLLTRDGGPTARHSGLALQQQWQLVAARHREALTRLAPLVETAAAVGVPDLRGVRLVEHWGTAVEAAADPALGAHALTERERRAALLLGPALHEAAAGRGRASLDHGDAHPGNLLVTGSRFLDLGDSTLVDADLALANTRRRAARELRGEPPAVAPARAVEPHDAGVRDALVAVLRCSVWLRLPQTARRAWPQHLPAAVRDAVRALAVP